MRRLALVRPAEERSATSEYLRIAIASRDGRAVNAHFGSAKRFVVYDVAPNEARLVETIAFDDVSDESGTHTTEGDDRNGMKIRALDGVQLLVVQAIGGPVAARVIRAKIHPIKLTDSEPVVVVIDKVRALLSGDTPPWLRRVINQGRSRSMDFLDEDEDEQDGEAACQ